MKRMQVAVMVAAALGFSASASAQKGPDLGKFEYESKCASCHGKSGKGDGPMKIWLTKPASDLTTLAKRNGGAFPTQRVWEMIDGRTATDVGPHGSREMPVWGNDFIAEAQRASGPEAWSSVQPEWYIRGRILALIDYMARMQVK